MNKLKRLFGPRALAATVCTGLLMTSVITYAVETYSMFAYDHPVDCSQIGTSCQAYDSRYGLLYYWCCRPGDTCGPLDPYPPTYGWCNHNTSSPSP
jgi:hypothetical protein